MQIRSADTRSRDPDDGILRMQYLWDGFVVDANPMRSPVIHRKHGSCSFPNTFWPDLTTIPARTRGGYRLAGWDFSGSCSQVPPVPPTHPRTRVAAGSAVLSRRNRRATARRPEAHRSRRLSTGGRAWG